MKKLAIAILAAIVLVPGTDIFAQGRFGADSAECVKYLSYYQEYFKNKDYDESIPSWREAYKHCPPTASQNMLIDGTTIMRRLIVKNQKNQIYKQALIDTLVKLHDLRAENYPKYSVIALNNKGQDLANYVKDDNKLLFNSFADIIAKNKENTKAMIHLFALNSAIAYFKEGGISAEEVIDTYQNSLSYLEKTVAKTPLEEQHNAKIKTDLESLFISSKVASCDDLIALFTPRYDAEPNNAELASTIVKTMTLAEDCMDNDLYVKAATTMYNEAPSYSSAYFLYKLNAVRGNVQEAIKYIDEAIGYTESDEEQDADYYFEAAAFCFKNGLIAKSFEYARQAPDLDHDKSITGKVYLLMGQIWGSQNCGGDEISKRAPYWVAVDYMQKAKNADATLTDECNKYIASYSKYYPQTAEAFMYDVTDGQAYTVRCNGMTASTVVRTQK